MNNQLIARLANSPQLPSLPAIALQVLDLVRKEDASISDIAKLIQNDAALSSKILKTVNSSFYSLPQQVSTISHALVILGLQSVKTLALGFSLVGSLKPTKGDNFDYELFWKRSIYSAVAARTLARKVNLPQKEEAFICGLLSDIGSLALHRVLGAQYDGVLASSQGDQLQLVNLCREIFDLDPAQAGGILAQAWGMPRVLVDPIRWHQQVAQADADLRPLVEVVYAAVLCGQFFAIAQPGPALALVRTELAARFKFSPAEVDSVFQEIGAHSREVAKLFELNIGLARDYQDIVGEATQTLTEITLRSHQQVQRAQQHQEELQQLATTDPLTGCANRARFASFIELHFAKALQQQRPLALIFVDADKFKSINDTLGHQAGDAVLKSLGQVLCAAADRGLVARYGGEEFAIVLPETDLDSAARKAESIRSLVEAQQIVFESTHIPVTISVGVAATDHRAVFAATSQLISAADRAVYAAKQAGRNCVRVFRPRTSAAAIPAIVANPL